MSTFDSGRLALVVAKSEHGDAEEVATGYFLTGDLVLTVRHAGALGSVFEVRCESGGTEKERWSRATVVWKGTGGVDAMLLRTERSFGTWYSPHLKPDLLSGNWKSSGYPKAADDDGNRKTQPLGGTFDMSRGQGDWELTLATDRNIQEKRQEYWKGLSGGPIFSATEEGGLVGIITDASRVYANDLRGLPVARLTADIEFVSHIYPSFLGVLPEGQFCAVLTREGGSSDLVEKVSGVIGGHSDAFTEVRRDPVEIDVLEAIGSVSNWAATVKALAQIGRASCRERV